ncbi:PleD family two-component system response regulator [Oleomonas cavernae]|uniref:diguanylate cyclase n=1 Tax=Oleomonas cavernae TaxID=2320859 RepID=A0A418WAX5_9PROT|nr:PleD family two-component system response regulator [Oleomonas cavernae]RJF87203.1 PleD family two-component system response regulator [Oleomonas cavernae]
MTAKVLVVDDVYVIRKVLEAKLISEYFEVILAGSGQEALDKAINENPDIVLLDVMMPDLDGFEVCRRLKADPRTAHIPVVMVTGLDHPSDRITGLEAGADDFLTKPANDVALFARVRNLVRLKTMFDELRVRESTSLALGLAPSDPALDAARQLDAAILVIEDDPQSVDQIAKALRQQRGLVVLSDIDAAPATINGREWDLVIVSLTLEATDGLRLCALMRSSERLRQTPVLVLSRSGDNRSLLKAFELGVNDYVTKPVDRAEILARVNSQLRRKRFQDRLRETMILSVEMAVIDPLTGLHNRRYLDGHLAQRVSQAQLQHRPLTAVLLDIDHFKAVNDTYGHAGGDVVLKQIAQRIRLNVRGVDIVARIGGEEFVVIMPEVDLEEATLIAQRLLRITAREPFSVTDAVELTVTTSAGIAQLQYAEDAAGLLRRADAALYRAKAEGRNRVVAAG